MIRHFHISGSMIALAVAAGIAGCATVTTSDSTGWRTATVVGVMPRTELPARVDRDCLGHADRHDAQRIVLVSFRMSRRIPFYRQAFALTGDETWSIGQHVEVQMHACRIRPIDAGAANT